MITWARTVQGRGSSECRYPEMEHPWCIRAKFLNLGTIDVLGRIVVRCGGCRVHYVI